MAAKKKAPAKKAPAKRATSGRPASEAAEPQTATVDKSKFKVKQTLTVPMMKLNAGDSYAIKIEAVRMQASTDSKKKGNMTVLRSVDLTDGEIKDFIAPTVLQSTLARNYGELDVPEDFLGEVECDWPGHAFLIEASKREGKRYMDVSVAEIDA